MFDTASISLAVHSSLASLADPAELAVGLQSEATLLTTCAAALAIIWSIFLLVLGRKFPLATIGTFFLAIGLLVGLRFAGSINYSLALAVGLVIYALGTGAYIFRPRLAMAVANLWPFAAIYVAYLYFSGSFAFNRWLSLGLVVGGGIMGAVLPQVSLAVVAAGLGTTFLTMLLQEYFTFEIVIALFFLAVLWQVLLLPRMRVQVPRWIGKPPAVPKAKLARFLDALKWAVTVVVVGVLALALIVPQPRVDSAPHPDRFLALAEKGELDQPGFVFSAEDNYYLFGRALPVALVATSHNIWHRVAVLFLGKSPGRAIHRMRAVKDENELEKMRLAATITSKAFEEIRDLIRPGVNEAEIEQAIHDSFRRHGATGVAFKCVVGSGANATRPHYQDNNSTMNHGLVVIDIGATVDNYASDMTRTFPVLGPYSPPERELVDIVIAAGDSARAHLRDGASLRQLHRTAKEVIRQAGFGKYFNHFIGHHVGLNVHDPPVDTLAAGMVITIEPGIYIPAGAPVDSVYWNLGVRIEDSYIVRENGYEEITRFPRAIP